MNFVGIRGVAILRTALKAGMGLFAIGAVAASVIEIAARAADVRPTESASGNNWPQWRGAHFDGISHETDLPTTWSEEKGVLWQLPLPGPAGSTPVVWGKQIFLTSAESSDPVNNPAEKDSLVLMSVSTDGKLLWKREISGNNRGVRGDEGNLASPSPSTDGRHVWAFMGTGELACYTVDGEKVWQYNLQDKYGKFDIQFGIASTPVLDDGRLYLQLLHSGSATVLALDAATGNEIWHQARTTDARAECRESYASPMLYRDAERAFLLTHGGDCIMAHRLSDGSEIFRCGGLNPAGNYNPTLRFVASPVAVPGLIIVPSAKNGPVLAIDPAGRGDITEEAKWHFWTRASNTPDVPSPLVYDGLVYLCREDGTLLCLDAKTGEELYKERVHSDRHRASPVYGDGKIYMTARDGTVSVVKAGPKFELLAKNNLLESMSSSPVISNGRIYLRTFETLYAIGKK
jgi:outer membrane protein assembly factor BamB